MADSVSYANAKDMLPFRAVERPGFQKMLSTFEPRYKLPSRKYFSKTGIPCFYNSIKGTVEKYLSEMEFFSATADLWSCEVMYPYISFKVHFINKSWEMKNLCLQTTFLPCDHTSDNLADALQGAIDSRGLRQEQLVCITTDSGSNIINATSKLGRKRLSCFGHN